MNRAEQTLLSHEETLELLAKAQLGDEAAKEKLYTKNAALVKSIVKKFTNRSLDFDDLYQLGCMGLVKAVNNYDAAFGVRFSTYAVPLIMGEIRRFLRDDGMVKVSRPIKETYIRAMNVAQRIANDTGREAKLEEIALELGITAEEVSQSMEAARLPISINAPIHDDGGNALTLDDCLETEDESNRTVDRVLLREMLTQLPPRERQVIVMRYFMDKTQSEIARQLGISQVQVSRLESRIMRKLRETAVGE